MVTMDMLEQDNYSDTTPTTTLLIPSSPSGRSFFFWMRRLLRSRIFMVDFLGSKVTLVCLRQSTRVSFMCWLDTPTLFSGLNAWIVVFDVEHEEYLEAVDLHDIVRGDHTHLACL